MYPFLKDVSQVSEADVTALPERQVAEGRALDFKEHLPAAGDEGIHEFLADVSSFANSGGGTLVYGVREEAGIATAVVPFQGLDAEKEVLRLANCARDGIAPPIPGLVCEPIRFSSEEGPFVVVLQVPKSWRTPHAITRGLKRGTFRFYGRTSAGKYPLEIGEVRSLFRLSETAVEQVRRFRAERLQRIRNGDTPAPLFSTNPQLVLHIVPLDSFDSVRAISIADLERLSRDVGCPFSGTSGSRPNFDGVIRGFATQPIGAYAQFFRNGSIEIVESEFVSKPEQPGRVPAFERGGIPSQAFEKGIIETVRNAAAFLAKVSIDSPFAIMLSMLGVRGCGLFGPRGFSPRVENRMIDRDDLVAPELLATDPPLSFEAAASLLRPVFDMIANAAGWERSAYYDAEGRWHEKG